MHFSTLEIKHLAKAWAAISLAFGILLSLQTGSFIPNLSVLPVTFVMSAIVVGLGFLLHELMHKYFAQKYHCWAEFRADDKMLLAAIAISFFGFIFAAPGAVYIQGHHLTKKQHGIISLAGPATNIILAILFGLLGFLFSGFGLLSGFFQYGYFINAWLAVFNLIPFGPLDGVKVLAWNKVVFGAAMAVSVIMVFFAWT